MAVLQLQEQPAALVVAAAQLPEERLVLLVHQDKEILEEILPEPLETILQAVVAAQAKLDQLLPVQVQLLAAKAATELYPRFLARL